MSDQIMISQDDLAAFCDGPYKLTYCSLDSLFSFERAQLEKFHLVVLRKRFSELSPKLPPLRKLAEENTGSPASKTSVTLCH